MRDREEPPILREEGAIRGVKEPEVPPQGSSEQTAEEQTPKPEAPPEDKADAQVTEKEPTLLEEIASWLRGKKHE